MVSSIRGVKVYEFLDIGFRSVAVYLFMLLGLRLFGKNQLSQLNAGDVILLLLISNAVQNAMVGSNTSLQGGIFAALVLFVVNFLFKDLMFNSPKLKDLIEEDPIVLIKNGILVENSLNEAKITIDELEESIREHGVENIKDVKLSILEIDGNISVISMDNDKNISYTRHKRKNLRHRL